MQLTPMQEAATKQFAEWFALVAQTTHDIAPFYVQQGFAGTGKSTALPFFIEAAGLKPEDVGFFAPTGKAAKVMTKKLRSQGFATDAMTVHKAIYRPKGLQYQAIETKIAETTRMLREGGADPHELQRSLKILQRDLDRAYDSTAPAFQLNPDAPLKKLKLVVVDEASMVGERMADDILFFGVPVLAIGDPGQLQPVGDNPGFFIRPPDNIFTEIHRQALDNPIIWYSKEIREGRDPGYGSHGGGVLRIVTPAQDDVSFDQSRDVQIIVGTNGKRHRMTRRLRKEAGLDARAPADGEMMICVKNSQKHPGLVNGTMLMVTKDGDNLRAGNIVTTSHVKDEDGFDYELRCIQGILEETYLGAKTWTASKQAVRHAMEDKSNHQIDWAYCITAHKSQGSQWNEVCVHDESGVFRDQSRQWLYTAVTRAAGAPHGGEGMSDASWNGLPYAGLPYVAVAQSAGTNENVSVICSTEGLDKSGTERVFVNNGGYTMRLCAENRADIVDLDLRVPAYVVWRGEWPEGCADYDEALDFIRALPPRLI